MVRSLRCLLVVLGLTLAVGIPYTLANAIPVPMSISPVGPSPSGLQSVVTFDARGLPGAANAGYYSRPVLVSNNTLGGLANGLLRRAVPVAAMIAAVEAAGWVIDELSKQVMDGVPQPTAAPPGTSYWSFDGKVFPTSSAAGAYQVTKFSPTTGAYYAGLTNCGGPQVNGDIVCQIKIGFSYPGFNQYNITHVANNTPGSNVPYTYPPAQPQPVPLANLGQLVKDNPGLWNDALRNPDGSVNRNPDVMAAANALGAELANETGPQPDPTAEWDTGQQGGNPAPQANDLPAFCNWASKICDWLDWTQQEPVYGDEDEYQLPIIDPLDNAPTWQSGLGNGVCPAPRVVETFVGSITFPFDIFCQLAQLLRGLVIAAAYLTAAYILLGVRRG